MASGAAMLVAAAVALVHLLAGKLRHVSYAPRSRWLSFSSGVAIAFVFLELLPMLSRTPERSWLAHEAPYMVAAAGFALYYGIEHALRRRADDGRSGAARGPFALGVGSYALLSFVGGYLLVDEERPLAATVLFGLALALKFLVADRGLAERHRDAYARVGRWLLAGAFVGGSAIGLFAPLPEEGLVLLTALLTGGILLTVVKEELPAERDARWGAFVIGAAVYALLLASSRALE